MTDQEFRDALCDSLNLIRGAEDETILRHTRKLTPLMLALRDVFSTRAAYSSQRMRERDRAKKAFEEAVKKLLDE